MTDDGGGSGEEPQLRIWESASRRQQLGDLDVEGETWEVHVVVERASSDLYRGRIAFRRGEEHMVTAPVIVEGSDTDVGRRAEELPDSMLRQFFVSVRG